MVVFLNIFKSKKQDKNKTDKSNGKQVEKKTQHSQKVADRKGELGEYKIDIQLDQLPDEYRYLSDLLIENPQSKSGYSQVDHVILTPYGIIVIETKNYQGTIYGGKKRKTWSVNGKFKMMNPFIQNYGHIEAIKHIIEPRFHDHFISMVSFTKRCTFKVETDLRDIKSSEILVYDVELTEFIKRKVHVQKLIHKEPLLSEQDITSLNTILKKAHISDPAVLNKHKEALKSVVKKKTSGSAKCIVCDKPVSDKVKSYCMSNKKFDGKVYCFEHQKEMK
ncbi:nuclease-related domain-containing protein [Pontibacillus marinus]|uniref:NERD nuclease n=1 Tax=Pontibacillus marinus BH030004 = DSM 16465 TaxID=1385511 RepID=A0A0A5I5Z0_9BACI|nr:nuclease-related domain-containing protein [Pontibacillus marinus]KGX91247.1 NERD nuclease [Pontibacillus marinus BH030004 = DSM 16465]